MLARAFYTWRWIIPESMRHFEINRRNVRHYIAIRFSFIARQRPHAPAYLSSFLLRDGYDLKATLYLLDNRSAGSYYLLQEGYHRTTG
jgi:hypothetical protein